MAEVQGVVERIATKQTAKGGTITNIQVNGEWYGMGFAKVNFGQGAEVEFDISWNGNYANVDSDTLNILSPGQRGGGSNGGGQRNGGGGYGGQRSGNGGSGYGQRSGSGYGQQQRSAPPRQATGGDSKDDYWKKKEQTDKLTQRAIQQQSARNSAIAFMDVLFKNEAVKLPAKQGDKMDAALALLDELTARFIDATRTYALGSKATQQSAPQAAPQRTKQPDPEPEQQPEAFDDDLPNHVNNNGGPLAGDNYFDDDIPY